MKAATTVVAALMLSSALSATEPNAHKGKEITFPATDGSTVYATHHDHRGENPLALLFHKGRSNGTGEYLNIVPRLQKEGYDVITVDQRSGGVDLGGINRTIQARGGETTDYCPAYADLEGALNHAEKLGYAGRIHVWGSSYSGALVINLGANEGARIENIVSFSIGFTDRLDPCDPDANIPNLKTPFLSIRPPSEAKYDEIKAQQALVTKAGHTAWTSPSGIHGASMLDASRSDGDPEPIWSKVLAFMKTNRE